MKKVAIGIMLLFIVSSIIPMAIGQRIETRQVNVELEEMLENLRFMCTTPYGFNDVKYEYYKEQLVKQHSSESSRDNMIVKVEKEDLLFPVKPLSNPVSSGGPMDSAWPMKCFDTRHTSRSLYSTADINSAEKWRFECGWAEDTPVIDSDGTIYVGCNDRYLYAINPDGTEKWKYKTGGIILGSSPAIDSDGTIYVGSWDTKLYAVNPDGTEKWKSTGTGGSIGTSPIIAEDGTIYIGNNNGKIVAIYPNNGTLKWYYDTGDLITSDPCIGDDGTIYIGSLDSYFYAMNPDGTLKWRFKTGDRIYGSPSIADDGTIYIGCSWDGYLYALYQNGTLKWKYGGAGTASNPSIGNDGTIYAGYMDNLFALYPNGTLKWNFYIGDDRFIGKSAPAISADGTIYFGIHLGVPGNSDGGEIIAVNPDDTERWRKKIANYWVESSPSIAEDGTVYIGSTFDIENGYLHAFGTNENNEPPSKPTITGPANGNAGVRYSYTFTSNDPENYPVKYYVEWDDDAHSGWTKEYSSGEEATINHAWSEEGTYTIRAKAIDISNAESEWETLTVTMPRNKMIYRSFYNFLENHPNMFPILRQLLQL